MPVQVDRTVLRPQRGKRMFDQGAIAELEQAFVCAFHAAPLPAGEYDSRDLKATGHGSGN